MGFFKEGNDYIDYTLLKKKGLLKVEEQKDVIDLSASNLPTSTPSFQPSQSATSTPTSENSNPFGFLDSNPTSTPTPTSFFNDTPSYSQTSESQNSSQPHEFNALKLKVEDLEYKLERLLEKITKVESKLGSSL